MRWIVKTIAKIGLRAAEMARRIALLRTAIDGVVMPKVIEFYIPSRFRNPTKWVPAAERGKIIEFCRQTRKSA